MMRYVALFCWIDFILEFIKTHNFYKSTIYDHAKMECNYYVLFILPNIFIFSRLQEI